MKSPGSLVLVREDANADEVFFRCTVFKFKYSRARLSREHPVCEDRTARGKENPKPSNGAGEAIQ